MRFTNPPKTIMEVSDIVNVLKNSNTTWGIDTYNDISRSIEMQAGINDYQVERFALIRMAIVITRMETGKAEPQAIYQTLVQPRKEIVTESKLITTFSEREACRTALNLLPSEELYTTVAASARLCMENIVEYDFLH
ncbi:MAG: hypothetical protein K5889_03180 [Lachnospiraceae bacterium]|nr:hypothetical protein [Lachnospiraceae bacterium]SDW77766.1 hypothetical protein SAMN05216391_11719 [Lachnospiraceae bacterium KHCPX20]